MRRLPLILLIFFALACNALTAAVARLTATSTPIPTPTLAAAASATARATSAVYAPPGCENVPPATVPPAMATFEPTPDIGTNVEISKRTQQRIFDQLVGDVERVYVYPDYNGRDWPSIVAKYRAKVQAGLDTESFYENMNALLEELGDEHSRFESPAQVAKAEAELSGTLDYVGIGILALPQPEKGFITVLSVFPDSAAEHGGLKPHDNILAVDGRPIVENGEAHTRRVRGPECSAVVLTVQSPGGPPRDLLFIRYRVVTSLPIDARLVPTADGSRIGYILLPSFFDETIPGQVEKSLRGFGALDALILDNRINSGGAATVVRPILSYFTSGTLGYFKSRDASRPFTVTASPIHNSQTVPLVVLVGEDTVSFGEIFSGALKDSGRAMIVGQTTQGNVETLHAYRYEDGSRAWIADETFDPAVSHANWEQTGIVPDVEVIASWETFTFETDPAIAAAVALLGHK